MTTAKFAQTRDKVFVDKLIDKNPDLKEDQVEFILLVEQFFLKEGRLPTHEEAQEFISISESEWSKIWRSNAVRNCLNTRGVPLRTPEPLSAEAQKQQVKAALTFRQLEAAKALYDPNDMRPDHTKLKKLGISTQEYNTWRKDPVFLEYQHSLAANLVRDGDDDAYRAFMDNIRSGDHQAIKMYFEMKGIYRPNDTALVSMQTIVQQIIDIIQREVTDPEQLQRISAHIFMAINQQTVQNPSFIDKSTVTPVGEIESGIDF